MCIGYAAPQCLSRLANKPKKNIDHHKKVRTFFYKTSGLFTFFLNQPKLKCGEDASRNHPITYLIALRIIPNYMIVIGKRQIHDCVI